MRRRLLAGGVIGALVATAIAVPAFAATSGTWTVSAPSGGNAAVITLTNGRLTLAAKRGDATVLSPAPIGISTSVGDFTSGLNSGTRSDAVVTQTYTMTTGKQRSRSVTYNQATIPFTGSNGQAMNLIVRAGGDGVAFRYVLPETGTIRVTGEASSFSVPTNASAWLNDATSDQQGQWRTTTAGGAAARDYDYPALFNVGGTYVSIAETDIDGRYTASTLSHGSGSGTYSVSLESQVSSSGPLSTAWRTAAIGDLAAVTASRIVDDMASPSKISDTSWIKPGQVAWSWMTEGTGDENMGKKYVDFAQQNGWPYVLIDAGWSPSWIPDLVNYAKAHGVGVIIWYDSSDLQSDSQLQQLNTAKSWGVAGVKIDYVWEHTQSTLQWFDKVLNLTANLHLMVNLHGTEMTRGMQRTWPHVMSSEAVFGAEQKQDNAAFDTILPYTRNQVSSMDFTPVDFSTAMGNTTKGHQVGMAVAFESGWQHYSDNPQTYRSQPLALAILNKTPTAWDETLLLGGTPGHEVYLARRYGDTWFIGGLSAVGAKTFTTALNFLGSRQYFVETVRDSGSSLTRDTATVTSGSTLSVSEAANGGFVSVICPVTPGITTCPKPDGGTQPPPTNKALNKPATADSSCNSNETAGKAVNGSVSGGPSDKWCSGAADKWWQVDLGSATAINTITIKHAGAGGESVSWDTRDYDIQVSSDGSIWQTLVQQRGNTSDLTTHQVSTTARYVKLTVLAAEQSGGGAARIFEVEVY